MNAISNPKHLLKKIRCKYIQIQILQHLNRINFIHIFQYNKKYQKLFDIKKEEYKKESYKIEIEIIPLNNKNLKFINIRQGHKAYFKIYFNDSHKEINTTKISKTDKVKKIKIEIDYKNNFLFGLFSECKYIKKINFLRFNSLIWKGERISSFTNSYYIYVLSFS